MSLAQALAEYRDISDQIYQGWLTGADLRQRPEYHQFDLEHLPEPYLDFGTGSDYCFFLTTNPGGGMPVQLRQGIAELSGGHLPARYEPLSTALAGYYQSSGNLKGAALSNINAMTGIADAFGFSRVMQLEIIPWHSANLPNKARSLSALLGDPLYAKYHRALRALLEHAPITLSWSAGIPETRRGEGMDFKAEMMGLDLRTANLREITRKAHVTQALVWERRGTKLRGLFVKQGSAGLPTNTAMDGTSLYQSLARETG